MINNAAIEKFINRMGIEITTRSYELNRGQSAQTICVSVGALYKKKLQYHVEDCFKLDDNGNVIWIDGDINVSPDEGVFSYLDAKNVVHNYFLEIATDIATKLFKEHSK